MNHGITPNPHGQTENGGHSSSNPRHAAEALPGLPPDMLAACLADLRLQIAQRMAMP